MVTLDRLLEVGSSIRLDYGNNNLANCVHHVRGIVDDDMIVIRTWVKHKARWSYECHHRDYYELLWERGYLKRGKGRKP